jgi:CRISPR system Cascade subunit CasA
MRKFNLISEKWIPVRFLDGTRDELGISDTLLKAKKIAAIEDPSPLVVAALHRFLLAILYRALEGPTDIVQAKAFFKTGLPDRKIIAYLEHWRDRFWLFDEEYPFWQVPTFKPRKWRSWAALAVESNADTAKVLFDHANELEPGVIAFSAAARWLLATQSFAISTGKSEISHTGTAPSAGSLIALPVGKSLHDTLLFCLIPENKTILENDVPIWERNPDTVEHLKRKVTISAKDGKEKDRTIEQTATGIVDLYTWRTRSVIIKCSEQEGIKEIGFASGIGYLESVVDPMVGHVIREVKEKYSKERTKKKFVLRFEEKGIWRDFDSLLPGGEELTPKVIEHATALCKKDRSRTPTGIIVLGQKFYPPRPNIAFWRAEYFVLPEIISDDGNLRFEINQMLSDAENAGYILKKACQQFAKDIVSHGERDVEQKDVLKVMAQMTALPYYWTALEIQFHHLLEKYTLGHDSSSAQSFWLTSVRDALQSAWHQQSIEMLGGNVWAYRALIKASNPIQDKLVEISEAINKLSHEEEAP